MMTDDTYADRRRAAIEEAAYALLAEKGYKATSMLAIARKAKASNETLYNWYGNKQGLFRSLVEKNAGRIKEAIENQLGTVASGDVELALATAGHTLLEVLTSERAIALNRAAAGDVHDTATLGRTLGLAGRQSVMPCLAAMFANRLQGNAGDAESPKTMARIWVSLLVSDIQIQLVTGARDTISAEEIEQRVQEAARLMVRLYPELSG